MDSVSMEQDFEANLNNAGQKSLSNKHHFYWTSLRFVKILNHAMHFKPNKKHAYKYKQSDQISFPIKIKIIKRT